MAILLTANARPASVKLLNTIFSLVNVFVTKIDNFLECEASLLFYYFIIKKKAAFVDKAFLALTSSLNTTALILAIASGVCLQPKVEPATLAVL
jgi:hypothetical protein